MVPASALVAGRLGLLSKVGRAVAGLVAAAVVPGGLPTVISFAGAPAADPLEGPPAAVDGSEVTVPVAEVAVPESNCEHCSVVRLWRPCCYS